MTQSNGNIFRVTGPLCGEFTGHRWIPTQRPVTRTCINWDSQLKSQWTQNELPNIKLALCDEIAICHRNKIKDALVDRKCTNSIASAFNSYIEQACKRTCPVKTTHGTRKARGPRWYDRECRNKRSQAIKAGERAVTNEELTNLKEKCNEYRACKQRKKRAFFFYQWNRNCISYKQMWYVAHSQSYL